MHLRTIALLGVLNACRSTPDGGPTPSVSATPTASAAAPGSAPSERSSLTFAQWPETVLGFPIESDVKGFQEACTKAGGAVTGPAKHECSKTAADVGTPGHVVRVECKDGTSLCSYFLFPEDKTGDAFRLFRQKLIGKYGPPSVAGNRTTMVEAIDSECKVLKEKFTHADRWTFRDGDRKREIMVLGSCEPAAAGLGKFSWSAFYFLERGSAESDAQHTEASKNF